jgi:hypothetical protein
MGKKRARSTAAAPRPSLPPSTVLDRVPLAVAVPFLIAVFVTLAIVSMRGKGVAFDETAHLPAGYTYWKTGDFRMNPEHPPLVKLWAALPLLTMDVKLSTDWKEWQDGKEWPFGSRFLYDENDASRLMFPARLMMVALGAGLGVLIWWWTFMIAGRTASLVALTLFAFTPDFLAHTQLVTTDLPVAVFYFGHAFFLFRALRQFTVRDAVLSGVFLGAALLSKFSAFSLAPSVVVLVAARVWAPKTSAYPRRSLLTLALTHTLLPLFLVWAAYGFHFHGPMKSDGTAYYKWQEMEAQTWMGARAVLAARTLHVVPEPFAYGFLYLLSQSKGRPGFLLGEISDSGWWYYFPVTIALKTPLPELLLIVAGCALLPARWRERSWPHFFLLVPVVLYVAVALASTINIGHRHLLPIYPFLLVLAGDAVARLMQARWAQIAAGVLGLWLIAGTALVHPDYLAYFNELAGGPSNGWRALVDSNLEWGQDLPALKRWMDETGTKKVTLSYFGTDVPERYGIQYDALPSFLRLRKPLNEGPPTHGETIAVSATNLQAVYIRDPLWISFTKELRETRQPRAIVAHSILIY